MISEALDAAEIKTIADALMEQSRERYADGLPRRPGANGAGLTGMFNRINQALQIDMEDGVMPAFEARGLDVSALPNPT